MKAYDAAKGAEQQSMLKGLMMDRKNFRTEIEHKRSFSQMFDSLSDHDRNQLLSQASQEVYSRINELYMTPDESSWFEKQDFADPLVSMGLERETADSIVSGAGYAGMGIAALLAARKGKKWLGKGGGKGGGKGSDDVMFPGSKHTVKELRAMAKSKFETPGIAKKSRGLLNRARHAGVGQGIDSLDNIPANKIPVIQKQIADALKSGGINDKEATALRKILTKLTKEGRDVSKAKIGAELVSEGPVGQGLWKKLKGGLKIGNIALGVGAGMVGSAIGGAGGAGIGSLFDDEDSDKGAQIGAVVGGTTGSLGSLAVTQKAITAGVPKLLSKAYKKHGTIGLTKLILKKGGPALVARLSAKGLFAGASSWTGLGVVIGGGLLFSDLMTIQDILQEEEDKGNI